MKIQYASDLHLEFPDNANYLKNNPIKPIGDVFILAGDITYLNFIERETEKDFIKYVSDNFKTTYLMLGNHEFYGGSSCDLIDNPVNERLRDNVFLVNNTTAKHDDTLILFTTLWSHISPRNRNQILYGINDFRLIEYKNDIITDREFNSFHKQSLNFLEKELKAASQTDKIVVATHHVPSLQCNAQEFVGSPINEAFVVNLDNFIKSHKIDYWIYGHTHRNMPKTKIGKTVLLTNQLGYVKYAENKKYTDSAWFETNL
jgi:predicted phosphohydrolase